MLTRASEARAEELIIPSVPIQRGTGGRCDGEVNKRPSCSRRRTVRNVAGSETALSPNG